MSDIDPLGRLRAAVNWGRDIIKRRPSQVGAAKLPRHHSLFLRGEAEMRAGNYSAAMMHFHDAYELDPTFTEAIDRLGALSDLVDNHDLAAKYYSAARAQQAAQRLGPPDRHFVLRQRGRFLSEVIAYSSVIQSMRKHTLPYMARGNALLAAGGAREALQDYGRALKLKPNLVDAMALKGEALAMLGQYADALSVFDDALARNPRSAETLGGRAIVHMALGHFEEARLDWRKQFELLVNSAARACVALRLADYKLALPQLQDALIREPADPYWRLYHETARRRLGLPGMADNVPFPKEWPGPLLRLHAGNMSEEEVLKQAHTRDRRAETKFQMGILALSLAPSSAEVYFREVIADGAPSLIEHAAACNELARPRS